jgi:cytochrome c553
MRLFLRALILIAVVGLVAAPAAYAQAAKEPGTVILKGSPTGGVKFDHPKHSKAAAGKCETCHHASKPEKPTKAQQEKCSGCHTKTATAPMKTKYQFAFHDALAKKGTCVDCHTKDATKKAPVKCTDCHKKENA